MSRKLHPQGDSPDTEKKEDWTLLAFASPLALREAKTVSVRVNRKVMCQRWTPDSGVEDESDMASEFISLRRSVDNVRRFGLARIHF